MKETDTMLLFWDGFPSQWHDSYFYDENFILYNCCEQYMMAQKALLFNDKEMYNAIMTATNPRQQKAIGRKVGTGTGAKPFDADAWNVACRNVVRRGNLFKFSQNEDLKKLLLATGDKLIVEASPLDKIWGIGLGEDDPRALDPQQWQGTNWLGEDVMFVRKLLTDRALQRP